MYGKKLSLLDLAYNHLLDEESRRWFDVRMDYLVHRDGVKLLDNIHSCFDEFHANGVEVVGGDVANLCTGHYKDKPVFIYGTGTIAHHTYWNLTHSVLSGRFHGFVSSQRNAKLAVSPLGGNKYQVLLPLEAYKACPNAIFIICSETYAYEMYRQISKQGIPQENIYIPTSRLFSGSVGYQYFDVFKHGSEEVFLDVGCFDGVTSLQFTQWCDMKYKKIVCFEPDSERIPICKKMFDDNKVRDVEMIPACCWYEPGEVFFSDNNLMSISGTSAVVEEEKCENVIRMKADTIDRVLGGEPATFIKMDIEGSELSALRGAQNTIRKFRPKLAISIYHKPEDVIEIPTYIMELNPDYKLTIRHYTSLDNETVLYAE